MIEKRFPERKVFDSGNFKQNKRLSSTAPVMVLRNVSLTVKFLFVIVSFTKYIDQFGINYIIKKF